MIYLLFKKFLQSPVYNHLKQSFPRDFKHSRLQKVLTHQYTRILILACSHQRVEDGMQETLLFHVLTQLSTITISKPEGLSTWAHQVGQLSFYTRRLTVVCKLFIDIQKNRKPPVEVFKPLTLEFIAKPKRKHTVNYWPLGQSHSFNRQLKIIIVKQVPYKPRQTEDPDFELCFQCHQNKLLLFIHQVQDILFH